MPLWVWRIRSWWWHRPWRSLTLVIALLVLALLVSANLMLVYLVWPQRAGETPGPSKRQEYAIAPRIPCLAPPTVSWTLPADTVVSDQANFNCFAWQEFIALNWKASTTQPGQPDTSAPASALGEPSPGGTPPPAVWETYAFNSDVFRPGGVPPAGFTSQPPSMAATGEVARALQTPRAAGYSYTVAPHILGRSTGVSITTSLGTPEQLTDIFQALTKSWLTAQNAQTTYYEVRLNEIEYDYIDANRLYDATCQLDAVQAGIGIHLSNGSIEVKAAWLPLTDPSQYARYLTAPAVVVDPSTSQPRTAVVGLIGLHIIQKTSHAQQFAWATFEHVDNAPDAGASASRTYTYFNSSCSPSSDPYRCAVNTQPPACSGAACNYATPMQIERQQPIPSYVAALNRYVWAQIEASNPDSVFQYYQLVNVMWPERNTAITGAATTPLTDGNAQPPATLGGLANTTIETYFQKHGAHSPNSALSQPSCLACHTTAAISQRPPGSAGGAKTYASDYSFLFGQAQAASPPPVCPQSPSSGAVTPAHTPSP
jgi:hypothetical protein